MDDAKEFWKDIEGYESLYQVSNYGKIKALPKLLLNNRWGKTDEYRLFPEKILKLKKDRCYLYVTFYKSNEKRKNKKIHRLVAEAFIPNPENKPEVNHKDGNKLNNNDWNLEWNTSKENTQHYLKTNPPKRCKLSISKVALIKTLYSSGEYTHNMLAKSFNVKRKAISRAINNKSWNF